MFMKDEEDFSFYLTVGIISKYVNIIIINFYEALCARQWAKYFIFIVLFSHYFSLVRLSIIMTPIMQIRKLRLRKVKLPVVTKLQRSRAIIHT